MTDITVQVRFASDPALPAPGIGVLVNGADGRTVSSAGTGHDGFELERSSDGMGEACVTFPRFALLKGTYWISVYLLSEDGIHVYDQAEMAAEITVRQEGLEQGIVSLRRVWSQNPAPAESESARKLWLRTIVRSRRSHGPRRYSRMRKHYAEAKHWTSVSVYSTAMRATIRTRCKASLNGSLLRSPMATRGSYSLDWG
jgi:hypothetical protein